MSMSYAAELLISIVILFRFVLNVCFTIIGAPFSQFVRERIDFRNESLAER